MFAIFVIALFILLALIDRPRSRGFNVKPPPSRPRPNAPHGQGRGDDGV